MHDTPYKRVTKIDLERDRARANPPEFGRLLLLQILGGVKPFNQICNDTRVISPEAHLWLCTLGI
ncbi:hypothetical protein NDI44_27455 [Trichocoleus sp. DQ-A3]|uniref:hypothetical protein n=1 Tax=Cyanophyceae TaxID=3028117 RepID=UPI0016845E91|nr:hypothetical protein [Coleofasciculus sp. FACHB-125]MBD1903610.1 hypothetical protein [Coleofasciculus sp. FACHB-125]